MTFTRPHPSGRCSDRRTGEEEGEGRRRFLVFGPNLSRPTGSFGQRQKPKKRRPKPEHSTLLRTGTFYFALTGQYFRRGTRPNGAPCCELAELALQSSIQPAHGQASDQRLLFVLGAQVDDRSESPRFEISESVRGRLPRSAKASSHFEKRRQVPAGKAGSLGRSRCRPQGERKDPQDRWGRRFHRRGLSASVSTKCLKMLATISMLFESSE